MDEDSVDAELIGNETSVLSTGATEAMQREAADVMTFLDGNMFDGICHVSDGDAHESFGDVARIAPRTGRCADAFDELVEADAHNIRVERFVSVRTEDRGKVFRLDLAQADVRVGDGQG